LTRGTLVFDDDCPLCSAVARTIEGRNADGLIALVPFSEAVFQLARAGIASGAARRDVWFLVPDGPAVRGVAVLAPIARRLPRWRRLAPVLGIRPVAMIFAGLWILLKQFRHEL
jgi:predicted DCC family thiol-disulfide oxidoreductase YuxK